MTETTHNPFNEAHRASCLRENLTSSSDGEGLETGRPVSLVPRQSLTRQNGIAEAVKFFHLNALSSPILVKVHFDIAMTMIADTLYSLLARKLRGFEHCDAPKLYRHFIRTNGVVDIRNTEITVTFPRRAHNPILRAVPWHRLPSTLPALEDAHLTFQFQ